MGITYFSTTPLPRLVANADIALAVFIYGNSISANNAPSNRWQDRAATLRPQDTYYNFASGGQYDDQMLANFASDVVPSFSGVTKRKIVFWWDNVDQMNDHATSPSQQITKLHSAAALVRSYGAEICVSTTLLNNDPPADPADTAAFNTLLRADTASYDLVSDPAADSRLQNLNDGTIWSGDGIHPANGGYAVIGEIHAATLSRLR